MIKKNLKTLIITTIVILLPILAGIYLWDHLPEQLPYHWNASGEVDGWCGKPIAVFGMPLLLVAIQWICALGTAADPKKANHSEKVMQLILWIVPVISIVMHTLVYMTALGTAVQVEMIMPLFIGLVFTIIGNYLPKCKQSYTIGIKLPWTLSSEENWNRTHRLAGKLWTVCGIVIVATAFLGSFWIFLPIILVMALVPTVYSYALHRRGI